MISMFELQFSLFSPSVAGMARGVFARVDSIGAAFFLEAISEMPQQDADASEVQEAEEVFRMALMPRDEPAVVL